MELRRRFQPDNLTNPGYRPNLIYESKGPRKNNFSATGVAPKGLSVN